MESVGSEFSLEIGVIEIKSCGKVVGGPKILAGVEITPVATANGGIPSPDGQETGDVLLKLAALRRIAEPEDPPRFEVSPLAWVHSGSGWRLSFGSGSLGALVCDSTLEGWRVLVVRGGNAVTIGGGLQAEEAREAAEKWALEYSSPGLLYKNARWRDDPATANQVRVLRRFRVKIPPGLSKGEAAELITANIRVPEA
jgi:hypothetical protein